MCEGEVFFRFCALRRGVGEVRGGGLRLVGVVWGFILDKGLGFFLLERIVCYVVDGDRRER